MITTLWMLVSCESETTQQQRAIRNEAKATLINLAVEQERFYLENRTYSNDMTELGFATDPLVTSSGFYTIDIEPGADDANFIAIAIGRLDEVVVGDCSTLKIDGRGNRTSEPSPSCWAN